MIPDFHYFLRRKNYFFQHKIWSSVQFSFFISLLLWFKFKRKSIFYLMIMICLRIYKMQRAAASFNLSMNTKRHDKQNVWDRKLHRWTKCIETILWFFEKFEIKMYWGETTSNNALATINQKETVFHAMFGNTNLHLIVYATRYDACISRSLNTNIIIYFSFLCVNRISTL